MTAENRAGRVSKRFSDLPDADPTCEGCGYCLRGQTLDGRCQECGTSVAASVAKVADRYVVIAAVSGIGDDRRKSDLHAGPWLLLAAWGCTLTLLLLRDSLRFEATKLCLWLYAHGFGIAGIFVATRPARAIGEPWDLRVSRTLLRFLTVVAVAFPTVLFVMLGGFLNEAFIRPMRQLLDITYWCSTWAGAAFFLYASQVAWRTKHRLIAVEAFAVFLLAGNFWLNLMQEGYSPFVSPADGIAELLAELPATGVVVPASLIFNAVSQGQSVDVMRIFPIVAASFWSMLVLVHLAITVPAKEDRSTVVIAADRT